MFVLARRVLTGEGESVGGDGIRRGVGICTQPPLTLMPVSFPFHSAWRLINHVYVKGCPLATDLLLKRWERSWSTV
ncbi:hypothetical protein VTI74DRAFT_8148 [Chaetomium olivicolor]